MKNTETQTTPNFTKAELSAALSDKLSRVFGTTAAEATADQIYKATLISIRDILAQKRTEFKKNVTAQQGKKLYYVCMEFLIGKSLKNNLCNLGIENEYRQILSELGYDLEWLYAHETDAALGNGGLGRLAACFMDALTTLDYSATGFSLLYEYGLFRQKILDGEQIELPDTWMPTGESWLVPRTDKACTVRFGGRITESWSNGKCDIIHTDYTEVHAVPYDLLISGADSEAVNSLRLWKFALDARKVFCNRCKHCLELSSLLCIVDVHCLLRVLLSERIELVLQITHFSRPLTFENLSS